jgi:hypothetical protein
LHVKPRWIPMTAWLCERRHANPDERIFPARAVAAAHRPGRPQEALTLFCRRGRSHVILSPPMAPIAPKPLSPEGLIAFRVRSDVSSAIYSSRLKRSRCSFGSGSRSRRSSRQMRRRPPRPREGNDSRVSWKL